MSIYKAPFDKSGFHTHHVIDESAPNELRLVMVIGQSGVQFSL